MSSVNGISPNNNAAALYTNATAGNTTSAAKLTPVEQGNLLRVQDAERLGQSKAETNGRIALTDPATESKYESPRPEVPINCNKIPDSVNVTHIYLGGAGVVGGGPVGSAGSFTGTDNNTGKTYRGGTVTGGSGVGLGTGTSGNIDRITVGNLKGMSNAQTISTPFGGINATSNGEGMITGGGITSPGKVGYTMSATYTHLHSCTVQNR
jgi:hypothetical protein